MASGTRREFGAFMLAFAYVLCGCAPDLEGDGELRCVDIPGSRGTLSSVATPDEKFVAFQTTGPSPLLLLTDQRLSPVIQRDARHALAPSWASSEFMLTSWLQTFQILSLPDLKATATIELQSLDIIQWNLPTLRPTRTGWVCLNSQGELFRLETSPFRVGRGGKAATKLVQGAATDEKTGTLVICGDGVFAEVFDLERMESVARCQLDRCGYKVRAGNGIAWIGTRDGLILHFDIASATVVGRTVLTRESGSHDVCLDLSASGRHLAASSSLLFRGDDRPTVLRVFRVAGKVLTEIVSAKVDLPHTVGGITILENEQRVILNGHQVFVWDYGAKR